jgi:hypothetical protein
MKFISMLNKIEEHIITSHFVLAQTLIQKWGAIH